MSSHLAKHYGFIDAGETADIYCHGSYCERGVVPEIGSRVSFGLRPHHRGKRAVTVRVIE